MLPTRRKTSTRWINRLLVNSIGLVFFRPDGFDEAVDHDVVFECHAQLAAKAAFDGFIHNLQHQRLGDASAPIFFDHAERDQPSSANLALVVKQFDQTKWE